MRTPDAILAPRRGGTSLTVAEAQLEVGEARRRLQRSFARLRGELTEATDWRTLGRNHPLAVVVGAAITGYLLAHLFRRR